MAKEDYDGVLLLTYPGIFEVVPKKLLREKIISSFDDEETSMSIDSFEINKIGQLINHDAGRFVQVDYTTLMSMRMKERERDEEKEQERIAFMLRMLKAFYGQGNCWFDETTHCFCFYQQRAMVGIEDAKSPQWTFMTYQAGGEMDRFIPADVLLLMQPPTDH